MGCHAQKWLWRRVVVPWHYSKLFRESSNLIFIFWAHSPLSSYLWQCSSLRHRFFFLNNRHSNPIIFSSDRNMRQFLFTRQSKRQFLFVPVYIRDVLAVTPRHEKFRWRHKKQCIAGGCKWLLISQTFLATKTSGNSGGKSIEQLGSRKLVWKLRTTLGLETSVPFLHISRLPTFLFIIGKQ